MRDAAPETIAFPAGALCARCASAKRKMCGDCGRTEPGNRTGNALPGAGRFDGIWLFMFRINLWVAGETTGHRTSPIAWRSAGAAAAACPGRKKQGPCRPGIART